MPFTANINEVRGRAVHAARIMAGFDQRQVAKLLKWSPAKLSGIENGAPINSKAWLEFRRAILKKGVSVTIVRSEGGVVMFSSFEEPEVEDSDHEELG